MKQKVSVPFMLLGILFNVCLIAANLLETKVIQVFGITVTAGLLVFLFLILSMIALLRCGAFVKHVSLSGVVLL